MNSRLLAILATALFLGTLATPVSAQSICHHYRWSSQRQCTSAKKLQFYNPRPKLHYPSRYYADRPHYYYELRDHYWRSYPWYGHHRWFGWPYRYPYGYWY